MQMSTEPNQTDPISVADQIQYLSDRGMNLPDIGQAERTLSHIGFHRLNSYWKPFELPSGTASGTLFKKGTSFNTVGVRYLFDQRLRSLLLEAFSFIEISVRTHWAYQLSNGFQHGEFAHQEKALFNQEYHSKNLHELRRTYKQSGHPGSDNFQARTIWDVLPAMSFGQLSKWYSTLADRTIRQSISQIYGMDERTLTSTLRHLTKIRNICAHHERLWDRRISTGLRIPKRLGSSRGCRQFKNIGLLASVSVIPAKAGTQNPVAGKYAFAANGLWIPAFAGMTVNMTTLPRGCRQSESVIIS